MDARIMRPLLCILLEFIYVYTEDLSPLERTPEMFPNSLMKQLISTVRLHWIRLLWYILYVSTELNVTFLSSNFVIQNKWHRENEIIHKANTSEPGTIG